MMFPEVILKINGTVTAGCYVNICAGGKKTYSTTIRVILASLTARTIGAQKEETQNSRKVI